MRAYRLEKKTRRLEVNHIVPCVGKHGELSCAHHLENLETLCMGCHKVHTAASRVQAAAAAAAAKAELLAPVAPRRRTRQKGRIQADIALP